uniref:Uncharacterized protein n=1 Tax=Oryza barthii TaxID=65489 RepID=A0A0D3FT91_9ORYZ
MHATASPVATLATLLRVEYLRVEPPQRRLVVLYAHGRLCRGGQGSRAKRARERKEGKREGDDVATLTCGTYVGPTLTQPPHRTKPGSKPPKDVK